MDNEVKNYYVSSSITSSQTLPLVISPQAFPLNGKLDPWDTSLGNIAHYGTPYFHTSSGYFIPENTPNIPLQITASIRTSGSAGSFRLMLDRQGDYSTLSSLPISAGSNTTTTITASYYGVQGDKLYLRAYTTNILNPNLTLLSSNLVITQSISPTASVCDSVIFEPYITTANFYNSDENAIMNNVDNERLSSTFQDVDYSSGILVPTNFDLIIEGDAQRAAVQDSNYTLLRHTNPRYNGSKSTSQRLNQWSPPNTTPGYLDEGTYGKLPTIDSTKTYVAYCDFIGGWPPERMNASGAHILYLIGEDGNVIIPNTSENSLYINKGTFESGERISISSQVNSNTGETNYRNIIRGGTRIEPILYTQIGHTPPQWTSSIEIYNGNSTTPITDVTYKAVLIPSQSIFSQTFNGGSPPIPIGAALFGNATLGWNPIYDPGSYTGGTGNYYYVTPLPIITEGINLIVEAQFIFYNPNSSPTQFISRARSGGTIISGQSQTHTIPPGESLNVNFNFSLTPGVDIGYNDNLYFDAGITTPGSGFSTKLQIITQGSYFNIYQNPIPNPLASITVGINSIWDYPISSSWSVASSSQAGVIYIPDVLSPLNTYYNAPDIKQKDASGSGFNNITLPWSIKYGDEFRFEGREDRVFAVKKVYGPDDQSPERISNTGSVEVHLNSSLPSASINLDHFLIRRYTDDASLILFEGYKPTGAEGPFLIKPEFVTPELNKSIDQVIVDLTQKGLL